MEPRCHWHCSAVLVGPDDVRFRVTEAYEHATQGGDLCLDPADCGLSPGLSFGPDAGTARLVTRSGGSTGRPRRILRSQGSWAASFNVMSARHGIGRGDRYGVLGDLTHSLSFYALAEALHLGAVCIFAGTRPGAMARSLADEGATVVYATPTQLRALDLAAPPGLQIETVRLLLVGGGPYDPGAARAIARRFPAARVETFYGTSETSFLTLGPPDAEDAASPFPGTDLVLRETPEASDKRIIWVGSPYLASAYAAGEAPAGPAPQRDEDRRLSLGEHGVALSDGRVRILGRDGQALTIADRTVFPAAIEDWLLAHDGIDHAAILPRPDPLRGHRIDAAICWRGGDLDALRAQLRDVLGPAATPSRLVAITEWPLLPSGKTDRARLRDALAHR